MIYLFDKQKKLNKSLPLTHFRSAHQVKIVNGAYTVDLVTPLKFTKRGTMYNHKKAFDKAVFVGHFDENDEFQLYRITNLKVDNNSVNVIGLHIFLDEAKAKTIIHDRRWQDSELRPIADYALNEIGWNLLECDVTDRYNFNIFRGSVLDFRKDAIDTYKVEMDYVIGFDGQKITSKGVRIKRRLGVETGERFAYGSNVLRIVAEQDRSEVYSAVIGRGRGEESGDGYGQRIEFENVVWSTANGDPVNKPAGQNYLEHPAATEEYGYYDEDGSLHPRVAVIEFDDIENSNLLITESWEWLLQNSVPKAVFESDVFTLGNFNLGDSIGIIYKDAGIIKKARVQKVDINLQDNRKTSFELGDYKHFRPDTFGKVRGELKKQQKRTSEMITRLKLMFDEDFDQVVDEIHDGYNNAVAEADAKVQASEARMNIILEEQKTEIKQDINQAEENAINKAAQNTEQKKQEVQDNLDSFKDKHQQLYDEVTADILDIDTFLGDKSQTLAQQFADVESDFNGLQSKLSGVESDLTTAKTNLQQQLDDARAEIDGIEVGGRNLLRSSEELSGFWKSYKGSTISYEEIDKTDEWGFSKAYKVSVFGGTETIKGVWSSGDSGIISNMTEPMTFENEYTVSMYVENIGDTQLKFDLNGLVGAQSITINPGESKRVQRVGNRRENYDWFQINVRPYEVEHDQHFVVGRIKIEKGTIATDWTPAPEDTEQKITSLNQEIEFIEGELSAKLEQTDIEPINNKITEYGNTLTANAQTIQSLLDKTELHDGDITKWSNETTANAESITSALSRISETEYGLSQAKTDIGINADGISGLVTDLSSVDGKLSSLTTDFNVEAGKIETLISKTDGHDTQLTNIVADYNSIEQTVAANDEWLGTHGSNVLQTVDGFDQKVWLSDVAEINPNLIPFADVSDKDNINRWTGRGFPTSRYIDSYGEFNIESNAANSTHYIGVISSQFELVEGRSYTLSVIVRTSEIWGTTSEFGYTYLMRDSGNNTYLGYPEEHHQIDATRSLKVWRFTADQTEDVGVLIGTYTTHGGGEYARFSFKEPKLEEGTERTLFMNAFSNIEQKANELSLKVQEITSGADGEQFLTESDITISSDRVLIGSTSIGSSTLASIISVSPAAVDIITDEMNLTGNLNVKGQIESISMSAVNANISELRTNILTSDVITSDMIGSNVIRAEHIFVQNAMIEDIVNTNLFTNNVKAMSIDAIYADLRSVNSEIMTSNIIKSEWLKVDTALFNRFTSSTAFIESLTAKTVFARDVQAITIDAVQANIKTVMNSMGQVEGGLTIRRPDNAVWVRNGVARGHVPVQVYDSYGSDEVVFTGLNFVTGTSHWQTFKYFYTPHEGTRMRVTWAVGLYDGPSTIEYMEVRVRTFSGYSPINMGTGTSVRRATITKGETTYITQDIPMPPPEYRETAAYLEFRRAPDGQSINNRVYARLLFIGQFE